MAKDKKNIKAQRIKLRNHLSQLVGNVEEIIKEMDNGKKSGSTIEKSLNPGTIESVSAGKYGMSSCHRDENGVLYQISVIKSY